MDYPRFNDQEVLGAKWLHGVKSSNPIYADAYRYLLIRRFEGGHVRTLTVDIDKIQDDSYIYFGTLNAVEDIIIYAKTPCINSSDIVDGADKIYANGGAAVYYR
jgi:uncharacterized membrane protein